MLVNSIILALFINWLMMNPVYLWLVQKLPNRPAKCSFCMCFWVGLIIAGIQHDYHYLVLAVTSPVLAVLIDRVLKALPTPLN